MTAVMKKQIQARPEGRNFLHTNIPFLDRNNPEAFSTCFQEDFQPFYSKKAEPFRPPTPTQVILKDLSHINDYLTEAKVSYPPHPWQQINRSPRWTLCTNFKMQTDPREDAFITTQSQKFQPHSFQPPPTPIRHKHVTKKIQHVEKLPESTSKASFTPHHCCPVVLATAKHLEEGFPTIKGDRRHDSFVSQYNNTFQQAWSRPAKPVEKPPLMVMGDPAKIVERETTHAASFSWPPVCRPPVVKGHLKLNLKFCKDLWSTTSTETFCHHKLGDPVVVTRRNQNSSSLPKGDTDTRRNKERMSVTTNNISFSHPKHTERPVYVSRADLMSKSHVQFSPPSLPDLYYTTTAKEHYTKKDGERARPVIQLLCNILSGPEHKLNLSTTKTDYIPLKISRERCCPSLAKSNVRFPVDDQHFSTTHNEDYTAKPLILRCPASSQLCSHFVIE